MKTFGQHLRELRVGRGLTQRDVERLTGGKVSNGYVSQLEADQVESPGVVTLHRLAAVLATDFGALCEAAAVGERPAPPEVCPHCGQVMSRELRMGGRG